MTLPIRYTRGAIFGLLVYGLARADGFWFWVCVITLATWMADADADRK